MIVILYLACLYGLVMYGEYCSLPPAIYIISGIGFLVYSFITFAVAGGRIEKLEKQIETIVPELNSLREQRGADALEGIADFGEGFGDGFAEASDDLIGFAIGKAIEWGSELLGNVGKSKREMALEARCKVLLQNISEERTSAWFGTIFCLIGSIGLIVIMAHR